MQPGERRLKDCISACEAVFDRDACVGSAYALTREPDLEGRVAVTEAVRELCSGGDGEACATLGLLVDEKAPLAKSCELGWGAGCFERASRSADDAEYWFTRGCAIGHGDSCPRALRELHTSRNHSQRLELLVGLADQDPERYSDDLAALQRGGLDHSRGPSTSSWERIWRWFAGPPDTSVVAGSWTIPGHEGATRKGGQTSAGWGGVGLHAARSPFAVGQDKAGHPVAAIIDSTAEVQHYHWSGGEREVASYKVPEGYEAGSVHVGAAGEVVVFNGLNSVARFDDGWTESIAPIRPPQTTIPGGEIPVYSVFLPRTGTTPAIIASQRGASLEVFVEGHDEWVALERLQGDRAYARDTGSLAVAAGVDGTIVLTWAAARWASEGQRRMRVLEDATLLAVRSHHPERGWSEMAYMESMEVRSTGPGQRARLSGHTPTPLVVDDHGGATIAWITRANTRFLSYDGVTLNEEREPLIGGIGGAMTRDGGRVILVWSHLANADDPNRGLHTAIRDDGAWQNLGRRPETGLWAFQPVVSTSGDGPLLGWTPQNTGLRLANLHVLGEDQRWTALGAPPLRHTRGIGKANLRNPQIVVGERGPIAGAVSEAAGVVLWQFDAAGNSEMLQVPPRASDFALGLDSSTWVLLPPFGRRTPASLQQYEAGEWVASDVPGQSSGRAKRAANASFLGPWLRTRGQLHRWTGHDWDDEGPHPGGDGGQLFTLDGSTGVAWTEQTPTKYTAVHARIRDGLDWRPIGGGDSSVCETTTDTATRLSAASLGERVWLAWEDRGSAQVCEWSGAAWRRIDSPGRAGIAHQISVIDDNPVLWRSFDGEPGGRVRAHQWSGSAWRPLGNPDGLVVDDCIPSCLQLRADKNCAAWIESGELTRELGLSCFDSLQISSG